MVIPTLLNSLITLSSTMPFIWLIFAFPACARFVVLITFLMVVVVLTVFFFAFFVVFTTMSV